MILWFWLTFLPPVLAQDNVVSQAKDYINQQCQELLAGQCQSAYDGKRMVILPNPGLAQCLTSGEAKAQGCPGEYTRRGAIRQLDVIKKRARNIVLGMTVEVVIDGQTFRTSTR